MYPEVLELLSRELGIHLSCRLSSTLWSVRYPARDSENPVYIQYVRGGKEERRSGEREGREE